jgi:hypothetical protein
MALSLACAAGTGCLSDLTKPAERDGGGPGSSDSAVGRDGAVGPLCDPAGPFEPPEPLDTLSGSINTGVEEGWPRLSRDGLVLYYVQANTRDGGRFLDGEVIFLIRDDASEDFDADSATDEASFTTSNNNEALFLSADNERLYFSTGADKVYVSARDGTEGPFPYPGEELGINAKESRDIHPYVVGDTLYFSSSRDDGSTLELYKSTAPDGEFVTAEPVDLITEIPHMQFAPVVSSDHRVIFFSADGALYRAVRQPSGDFATAEPVEELDEGVSYPGSLSPDDCLLYFHTDRRADTDFDIYVARATVMF